jgi:excisionase family DNA binding protein
MQATQEGALLITIPEAGARLGVGRSTVYELIQAGEIETVHIGRAVRVPMASLRRYVDRLTETVIA